jgi:hypothetical protein
MISQRSFDPLDSCTHKLYQRTRVPSLRPGLAEKAVKPPSILHANASVNAADLTETAFRTADTWNPTGLPARLGLCFCAKGMNGKGTSCQCYRQES